MKRKLFGAIAQISFLVQPLSVSADSGSSGNLLSAVVFYLPNRILDVLDIFSLNIGAGQVQRAEVHATQGQKIGAGLEYYNLMLEKGFARQYGGCIQDGYELAFVPVRVEDYKRPSVFGSVVPFYYRFSDAPLKTEKIFEDKCKDYYALGGSIGAGVGVGFDIHPIECLDAVLGFVLIDISQDDLTFESFK